MFFSDDELSDHQRREHDSVTSALVSTAKTVSEWVAQNHLLRDVMGWKCSLCAAPDMALFLYRRDLAMHVNFYHSGERVTLTSRPLIELLVDIPALTAVWRFW